MIEQSLKNSLHATLKLFFAIVIFQFAVIAWLLGVPFSSILIIGGSLMAFYGIFGLVMLHNENKRIRAAQDKYFAEHGGRPRQ